MDELYETLCDVLEEELERQETALLLLKAQQEAIIARDADALDARTEAIDAVVAEAAACEKRRHEVLREILRGLNLPKMDLTLSILVNHAPGALRERLAFLQERLQTTMQASREQVYTNARMLRHAYAMTRKSVLVLTGQDTAPKAYSPTGASVDMGDSVSLVNARG